MKSQSGNVLVFILIAIILIGLLTVSLTRSSNTTNDTGSYEQNQIAAAEILRYAKSIEVGVQNLLARGCGENELSFWHDSDGNGTEDASDDYYNPTAPSNRSCHVYQSAGAGIAYTPPLENWLDQSGAGQIQYNQIYITGRTCVDGVGADFSDNCQTSSNNFSELLIYFPYIKEQICQIINKELGINEIPLDRGASISNTPIFTGNYSNTINIGVVDAGQTLKSKRSGCLESVSLPLGGYHFYHVLHAR